MQVTIQSFWKPVSDQMLDNCLFYIETTMGKIYSPLKFLFQNFYTGATISEEKLLATLISYHLKEENQELYTTLITRLITHTPQYIFDEFIKNGETSEFIPNLFREDQIYNRIKEDKVCQYIYFNTYTFQQKSYEELNKDPELIEKTYYFAANDIAITKEVNRYNYMGVPYYYNTDFLLYHLSQEKLNDTNIQNYLLPYLTDSIKQDPKLWLHLIDCPKSYLSITSEEFRIKHFEEYRTKNKTNQSLALFYLSLSKENRLKYSSWFTDLKLTKQMRYQLELEEQNTSLAETSESKYDSNPSNLSVSNPRRKKEKAFSLLQISTLDENSLLQIFTTQSKKTLKQILSSLSSNDNLFKNENIMQTLIDRDPKFIKYINTSLLKNKSFLLKNIDYLPLIKGKTGIEKVEENGTILIHPQLLPIYKFHYDWNEWNPTGLSLSKNCLQTRNTLEEYEYLFIRYGDSLKPIYDKYYPRYLKKLNQLVETKVISKEKMIKKENFLDFISTLLQNEKNFTTIYNDPEISIITFNLLRRMLSLLKPEVSKKVRNYMQKKRQEQLEKYNNIVIDHLNGINTTVSLEKAGLSKEQFISSIMQKKSLYKQEKETLLRLLLEEKYILTVKDVIYLLEEMKTNQMTIDEILASHEIPKTMFYKIYKASLKENPLLHEIIQHYLHHNKKNGLFKLKSLALMIIHLNPQTEKEFSSQFPNINLSELATNLARLGESTISNSLEKILNNWKKSSLKTLTKKDNSNHI